MSERLCSKEGVPHKNWQYRYVYDHLEENGDYFKCEMCGKDEVRYVHVLYHDDYGEIRVGCVCAGKMIEDYEYAKISEENYKKFKKVKAKKLKQRLKKIEYLRDNLKSKLYNMRYRFNQEKKTWTAKIYDEYVTIKLVKNFSFAYVFRDKWTWNIDSFEHAKLKVEEDLYNILTDEVANDEL